ncbi:ankyrin repeat domain-containing protein 2-like [Haliotis rufescens]|uniref:ankyrin repeat domain-containing protein 2-like n=1 Tax=Haliotis rufescens TaxID=6454 RepID=UPI00201FA41C|nr:ankyrin repeat domain-containing protein 2-like [Haliotis rufescens]
MADPEHKDEEGAPRSHPQQKDDDETYNPHIQEKGDNSSLLSQSPQKKVEDTCLPHPQKTEEDKTSHPRPQQTYVKGTVKYQPIGIKKASSDPNRRRWNIWLSTASHATPSRADIDLFYASWVGDLMKVKRLLTTPGVVINCRVGWGSRTPVMWAARGGHTEVVELLVKEGANVSLVDKYGNIILHLAFRGGNMETVEFVLSLNVVDIDA